MRKNPLHTDEDKRMAAHMLDVLDTECGMLVDDGGKPRLVCIALLMTACRIAGVTQAITPKELHHVFHHMLDMYTAEDGT